MSSKQFPIHSYIIQAVQLILKPRKFERDRDIHSSKQTYETTGSAKQAFALLDKKRNRCIEGRLLGGLMNAENDYVNALEKVPRNMRLLYIHAFQSFVWNKLVSRRIKEFGMTPIVGDIVIDGDFVDDLECIEGTDEGDFWSALIASDKNDKLFDHALSRFGGEAKHIAFGENPGDNETEIESADKDNKKQVKIKFLTEDDLSKYTIYDIVLPLPGYDISYPANIVKKWYEQILDEYGLTLEMPKQRVKTYTLSGTYRKIIEKVSNMSWKIMEYNDHTAALIRSDLEELRGKPEPVTIPDGKFKALIVDFCLSSSCYATMALREVMKMDTSVETHMNLDYSMQNESTSKTNEVEETNDNKRKSIEETNECETKKIKTET